MGSVPEWEGEIFHFLEEGKLLDDLKAIIKVHLKAAKYAIVGGSLYRRGHTLPLFKCLSQEEADYVLKEIHEVVCGSHSRGRILAHKAVRG